jgi:hypothetical protein
VQLVYYQTESDGSNTQTPNFAMDTTDINSNVSPIEEQCTAQIFCDPPDQFVLGNPRLHSGSPLWLSHSLDWAPAILFDAVYAGAVLHNFGTKEIRDMITKSWKDTFYPGGIKTTTGADHKVTTDKQAATMCTKRMLNQGQESQEHYEVHYIPDVFDMLLALPYVLVPPAALQAAKEKTDLAEQRCIRDKVDAWNTKITCPIMSLPSPLLSLY